MLIKGKNPLVVNDGHIHIGSDIKHQMVGVIKIGKNVFNDIENEELLKSPTNGSKQTLKALETPPKVTGRKLWLSG
jgi:UDP-N-acetyl-D-mannosaminuronate dehydrogenase